MAAMALPSSTASRASSASSLGRAARLHASMWKCWSSSAWVSSWAMTMLLVRSAPVGNVKFLAFRVVKPLDLLGEHVYHEGVEVESLRQQAKRLGRARVGVALGGILFLVHLLDNIRANFLPRPQGLLQWGEQLQPRNLAHLLENFVRRGKELCVIGGFRIRTRRPGRVFLCVHRQAGKTADQAKQGG